MVIGYCSHSRRTISHLPALHPPCTNTWWMPWSCISTICCVVTCTELLVSHIREIYSGTYERLSTFHSSSDERYLIKCTKWMHDFVAICTGVD